MNNNPETNNPNAQEIPVAEPAASNPMPETPAAPAAPRQEPAVYSQPVYQQAQYQQQNYQPPQYQPPQYQQQNYQQPQYQQPVAPEQDETVSLGEWVWSLLVLSIPCVNIIMLLVFAFGNSKKSKSNYAKAQLIFVLISIVLSVISCIAFFGTFAAIMSDLAYAL